MATTALLPEVGERLVLPGGAGLTSKPHRDRSTTSRLTWAVSPAAGIGLPSRAPRSGRETLHSATTDPGGCHRPTLACPGPDVRSPECLLPHARHLGGCRTRDQGADIEGYCHYA